MKDRLGATTSFTYDTRGNQISRGGVTQTFDEFNRPTTLVSDAGQTVTLTWHEAEYRLKTFKVGAAEARALTYDSHGRIVKISTASWSTEYVYDESGLAAMKTGGVWHHLDRTIRGDIAAIRDSSGSIEASLQYSAYGELLTDNHALVDRLAMTYGGRDGSVNIAPGLHWMGARVYRVDTALFVSVDPLLSDNVYPEGAYGYAGSDPINRSDPSGMASYLGEYIMWCGSKRQSMARARSLANPLGALALNGIRKYLGWASSWALYSVKLGAAADLARRAQVSTYGACFYIGIYYQDMRWWHTPIPTYNSWYRYQSRYSNGTLPSGWWVGNRNSSRVASANERALFEAVL